MDNDKENPIPRTHEWDECPAWKYITERIAMYPTLFRCSDHVIMKHVFCDSGIRWDERGLLQRTTEDFTIRKISMKVAWDMFHNNSRELPIVQYNAGTGTAIRTLPNNIEATWLEVISEFLHRMGAYTTADWEVFTKARTLLSYSVQTRPAGAENIMMNYTKFAKQIPEWLARVKAIYYYKQFGGVDPRTYMAAGI